MRRKVVENRSARRYDFNNNQQGDSYIFLIDYTRVDSWHAARAEFIRLSGPTPVLPDLAFSYIVMAYIVMA